MDKSPAWCTRRLPQHLVTLQTRGSLFRVFRSVPGAQTSAPLQTEVPERELEGGDGIETAGRESGSEGTGQLTGGWRGGGRGEPLHFLKVGQCVVSTVRQFAEYKGICRLPP